MSSSCIISPTDSRTVGVLGGGQLGRMMAEAAHRLGIKLHILDPKGVDSPAGQIAPLALKGSFSDETLIRSLSKECDMLTIEIEHVNASFLSQLEQEGVDVCPAAKTIQMIQDKYKQKQFFSSHGFPTPEFCQIDTSNDAIEAGKTFGYPFMLKSRCMAYDGRGNYVINCEGDIETAFRTLGTTKLYAEKWINFVKELAVMVVRGDGGEVRAYPVVETTQKNNICHTVLAPAQVSYDVYELAKSVAFECVSKFEGRGIFGVELFLDDHDRILLNEVAPRPHNSGHYTIEACETDQFEQHLRAVLGLPLGSCDMRVGAALMLNILGDTSCDPVATFLPWKKALQIPGVGVHYYGKDGGIVSGRKLAHLTIVASSMSELHQRSCSLSGDSIGLFKLGKKPIVGVIMGSDSDLPSMKAGADILEQFNVPYELSVVSAHRTPKRMYEYAQSASKRGIRVIIAGAGGAAHLPGMVAALTHLPVIGVPILSSALNGQDSLLSIVQMPRGIPVATVAIGNSTNAGLLAVRMLGMADTTYAIRMQQYMEKQEREVEEKVEKMSAIGWSAYLSQMK